MTAARREAMVVWKRSGMRAVGPVVLTAVPAARDTGYDSSESTIAVTNAGAVVYSPAQNENSVPTRRSRSPAPDGCATARSTAAQRGCVGASRLVIPLGRVPGGRVVRAVVYVNGRRVLSRRGRRLTRVSVRRPAGRRIVVRIVTTNNKRGRVVTVRSYRGCARSPLHTRHV